MLALAGCVQAGAGAEHQRGDGRVLDRPGIALFEEDGPAAAVPCAST